MKKACMVFTISIDMYNDMGTIFWKAIKQDLHSMFQRKPIEGENSGHLRECNDGVDYERPSGIDASLEKLRTRVVLRVPGTTADRRKKTH